MSSIGEAIGCGKEADAIDRRLRHEVMPAEERATLERRVVWLREESAHAWADTKAEARREADDDRMDR